MWWRKEIGMSISALDDEVFCCAQFGGFSGAFLGVEHFSQEYVALVARLLAILKRGYGVHQLHWPLCMLLPSSTEF